MSNTILQVPIDKGLRDQAFAVAQDMGFSSLQESVRVFLRQMAKKRIGMNFEPEPVKLSAKAIRRYDKINEEIDSGKVKLFTARSVDELMEHLNQDN